MALNGLQILPGTSAMMLLQMRTVSPMLFQVRHQALSCNFHTSAKTTLASGFLYGACTYDRCFSSMRNVKPVRPCSLELRYFPNRVPCFASFVAGDITFTSHKPLQLASADDMVMLRKCE